MKIKRYAVMLYLLSILALAQNSSKNSNQATIQAKKEEQFQIRRQQFATGRQLLFQKGVPFDPDELLREDWTERLKPALDTMPEMHQSRYESAPLNGAYFADTVYLPEKVQLSGHTLILANYVVFEGKNPVIKGNFDLHFFPTKPVVVLETTLAEALHKKAHALNVNYAGKYVLPPFALIQDLGQTGPHQITLDVSGPPNQAALHPSQRPRPKMQQVSWNGLSPSLFPAQSTITCSVSCDNNGNGGATGASGANGDPGTAGASGGPQAASGSCLPNQSPNGMEGMPGAEGGAGGTGTAGSVGLAGGPSGNITVQIALTDTNQYTFNAKGGQGGQGGTGGAGGIGGNGGTGAQGGNGVACGCDGGNGGNGGEGGTAGQGGKGGNGANGGPGGAGGNITGTYPSTGPVPITSVAGGQGGAPGQGGPGGPIGNPGSGGQPGVPATACGVTASAGSPGRTGPVTATLGPGSPGQAQGATGPNGSVNLSAVNPGGGGGSGGDCSFVPGPTGQFVTGDGGGDPPPCNCPPGQTCIGPGTGSPVIIDTEGEGFHLTAAVTGVTFDISGTGHPVQIAWTDAHFHNAFLALPGPDGLVHNGKELFGNFTPQPQSAHPNGFIALAQYDKPENGGNGDGIIDEHDQVFSQLRLWIDENHDGVCQPNELHRLPELGVYSLALDYKESRRTDQFGNQFRYKARVNPGERQDFRDQRPHADNNEVGRWTYDVFFIIK